MPQIICVGLALIDALFSLDQLPKRAGKHFAHHYDEVGGGIAANGAVTISRLGGSAAIWGRLGDDGTGQRIKAELNHYGVNTDHLSTIAGCQSPLSTVLIDAQGERLIVNFRDPDLFAGQPDLPLASLAEAGAVLADLRWPAGTLATLQAARQFSVPSLLDFDQTPDASGIELLPHASHVVFGREALAAHSGVADPAEGLHYARQHTQAELAVTLGSEGLIWLQADEIKHLPAFPIKAVDTLAAGDVFHGALALALSEAQPFADGLRFAAATAALKCTRFGGRRGIPTRSEVEEFLQHN